MNDHAHKPALHTRAEPYCFLCQKTVPKWPGLKRFPAEMWEHELVAVHAQDTMVCASRLTLPGCGTNHDHHPRLDSDDVQLCWDSGCSRRHGIVYTAHQDCWSVARSLRTSLTSLFSLAQCRRQILPLQHSTRPDARIGLARGNEETPLGEFLREVACRLPFELQEEISKCLRGHLVACLSLAALETALGGGKPTCRTPCWENVAFADGRGKLNIRTSQILGLEYISEVSLDDREGVSTTGMRGIRFALDTFGIRGIRIAYQDDSFSPWLGDHRFSWYGEAYGSDLSRLRVIRDARRVIRLDFTRNIPQPPEFPPRALWSQERALDTPFNYAAADLGVPEPSPAFYEGWALYPYISFGTDGEYMSGLTAYCSPGAICGLATHGDHPQSIGSKDGIPLHVALQPRERIVSVWVCTHGPPSAVSSAGPYLLITTSLGRSYFLGHYYLLITGYYVHWTQLTEMKALVLGLSHFGRSLVGAAWRPNSDTSALHPAAIVRADILPPVASGMKVTGVFLSTATLVDTSRLQLRRQGGRCAGLLVEHHDGSTEALGAWDPTDMEGITAIYEAYEDGPLDGIAFCLTYFSSYYRVTDVLAVTESLPAPDGYRVFSITSIAWWFGRLFDDVLEWQGRSDPVHEISPLASTTITQNLRD